MEGNRGLIYLRVMRTPRRGVRRGLCFESPKVRAKESPEDRVIIVNAVNSRRT